MKTKYISVSLQQTKPMKKRIRPQRESSELLRVVCYSAKVAETIYKQILVICNFTFMSFENAFAQVNAAKA